jgi:hypothetical protein
LFADLGKHEVFTPVKDYQAMTIAEIARQWPVPPAPEAL